MPEVLTCTPATPRIPTLPDSSMTLHEMGMDIVGKLPPAPGKRVFLLMVTDYFTKWIEAGAFQQVKEPEVIDFIWKNVVCRFGLPYEPSGTSS